MDTLAAIKHKHYLVIATNAGALSGIPGAPHAPPSPSSDNKRKAIAFCILHSPVRDEAYLAMESFMKALGLNSSNDTQASAGPNL